MTCEREIRHARQIDRRRCSKEDREAQRHNDAVLRDRQAAIARHLSSPLGRRWV